MVCDASAEVCSIQCISCLFLENKSVLELPRNLDQSAGPWVVFCLVDFADGFLKSKQCFFQFGMGFGVVAHRRLAAQVIE